MRPPDARRLKDKIYKTVVRPVALYAAECWLAATNHEKALHAMEMLMLRWSLGLTRLDHATNVDVRGLMQVAPIQAKMQEARLRWFCQVMRRGEESVVRTALRVNAAGQRPQAQKTLARQTERGHENFEYRTGGCPRSGPVEKDHPTSGPCAYAGTTLGRRSRLFFTKLRIS